MVRADCGVCGGNINYALPARDANGRSNPLSLVVIKTTNETSKINSFAGTIAVHARCASSVGAKIGNRKRGKESIGHTKESLADANESPNPTSNATMTSRW
jgi:hypothetical protein